MIKNREDLLDNAMSSSDRKARDLALTAVEKALEAVDPIKVMKSRISIVEDLLKIDGNTYDLSNFERIIVVGGGKASGSMAEALEAILRDRIESGVIVTPHGTASKHRLKKIEIHEAGHPIPDDDSVKGAKKIVKLVEKMCKRDLVFCLISGGGSSLMSLPREEISLKDKQKITDLLLKSGATINEINAVRKHISQFKGGNLARRVHPATLVSLILSDVVGDPLDVIASGPTVPDSSTFRDAVSILKKYELWKESPSSVRKVLSDGAKGLIEETSKSDDVIFNNVNNIVIGSNRLASLAASRELRKAGMNTLFLTSFMEGEARDVGLALSAIAREVNISGNPLTRPAAIVIGGETTVTVTGSGIGGRNQEIALNAAMKISGLKGVTIASFSTDGIDGPTDAAGALVDGNTVSRAERLGLNAPDYLKNNDSYSFFSRLNDLIFTGSTGTNVNDISLVILV